MITLESMTFMIYTFNNYMVRFSLLMIYVDFLHLCYRNRALIVSYDAGKVGPASCEELRSFSILFSGKVDVKQGLPGFLFCLLGFIPYLFRWAGKQSSRCWFLSNACYCPSSHWLDRAGLGHPPAPSSLSLKLMGPQVLLLSTVSWGKTAFFTPLCWVKVLSLPPPRRALAERSTTKHIWGLPVFLKVWWN